MRLQSKPELLPFKTVILISFLLSSIIQLVIVSYNHFTGYVVNQNIGLFLFRWLYGTALSALLAPFVIYPDILVIRYLNKSYSWHDKTVTRIFLQLATSIITAILISSVVTLLANFLNPYADGLLKNLVNNALITIVINIILMIGLEALIFFRDGRLARIKSEKLEKELSNIRFEVLKNQINPHFLFNSLNVLSSLINRDTQKAQLFIEEFSQVYRYVLETIEKPVVTVAEELGFSQSYMFLQQIRYGDSLKYDVRVDAGSLNQLLPPLSLQLVLENAMKHNVVNPSQPLLVRIYEEPGKLIIQNNIQKKISSGNSTGIGQKNLIKRYRLISKCEPEFVFTNQEYIVKLPLINIESDESSDN